MTREDRGNCMFENVIIRGEALATLRTMPSELVDVVVTSPPYYRQRNYENDDQQLGQEATPEQYVDRLVGILRESLRVLRDTGSLWLVLGDKYLHGRQLGMPWRVALALSRVVYSLPP